MEEFAIELENISKTFKIQGSSSFFSKILNGHAERSIVALDNISFKVPKSHVLAIIGRNGSGKTTLLRTIAGIYQPDKGSIKVNGTLAPLLHIGTGFQKELNAQENLIMSGLLMGMSKKDITSKVGLILEYAELEEFTDMKLKNYSTGMRARLAFSLALQVNPDILLVDELLAVGDKEFRKKSSESFLSFKKQGKTIVYSTHNLGSVSKIADSALFLQKGKMIKFGDPEEVINEYQSK